MAETMKDNNRVYKRLTRTVSFDDKTLQLSTSLELFELPEQFIKPIKTDYYEL